MGSNKGFTLIEAITAMLIISVIASSIMIGITTVEKKLFKIRLKEKAFEELKIYTDFLASRILVESSDLNAPEDGYDIPIYQIMQEDETIDVYSAKINYCVEADCREFDFIDCEILEENEILNLNKNKTEQKGKSYELNTWIIWPNEYEFKDTLKFCTYQVKFN